VSVASFIASQRADHGVPHVISCRALEVSESWFYKWHQRPPTARQLRRAELDTAVAKVFQASEGRYGSPRVHNELVEAGWTVSEAVANVSPARLCGNGLRETPEQQPRMRSPYETLGYSGISFVVNL